MDQRLTEAARLGDVAALDNLLKQDPLILQKVSLSSSVENPLHIASLAGKVDFARQIIALMPSFAMEINNDGYTPLHIAAAAGHLEVVSELLTAIGPDLCLLKDKGGRTPLHLAAVRGRVLVMEKLLSVCPKAIEEKTPLGETALLLAVKNCQFAAFKILFEASKRVENHEELINAKDVQGNSISEIAIATKQLQVIDFLKQRDQWTHQQMITVLEDPAGDNKSENDDPPEPKKFDPCFLFKATWGYLYGKDIIPVVASLIAGATYTVGINPPSTIWKEGMNLDTECITHFGNRINNKHPFELKSCDALRFYVFMVCNTIAFVASILLLPFHQYAVVAPLLIITSLSCMLWTYITSAAIISPSPAFIYFVYTVMCISFVVLFGLPALTVVLHIRPAFGKIQTRFRPGSTSSSVLKS
ncbi:hypothetical protein SLE2022_357810 [Rubroshorea leprosula]